MSYREYGSDGPVLLLIHGIGAHCGTWEQVAPLLAREGMRVVTVDLPGHGQSGTDHGDYSLPATARTLNALLERLGHSQVTVVGHSLGGGVALQLLRQHRARVAGLVLVSSGGLGKETGMWLRLLSIPGSGPVLAAFAHQRTLAFSARVGRVLHRLGVHVTALSGDTLDGVSAVFTARDSRRAFLATLRSVVNVSGQKLCALDSLKVCSRLGEHYVR